MRVSLLQSISALLVLACSPALLPAASELEPLRPPATPLVTHDPYFSIWSTDDRLTDGWTKHWTGTRQSMTALIRIDGKLFRLMGPKPETMPALNQVGLVVWPTRTVYQLESAGIRLDLTFLSPLLPGDLEVLSRPVSYLTFEARSTDALPHEVSIYFDCSGELAVNTLDQKVAWSRYMVGDLDVLRLNHQQQPIGIVTGL